MKGIILAGGSGTRLHPLTLGVTKQLLPVYNKPMIYYPLSVLMLAGIREVLIISTPQDQPLFQRLLQDGSQLGMKFSYAIQPSPNGLAEAFIIGETFIGADSVCLILGDNLFYGDKLCTLLQAACQHTKGASLFGYEVKDPHRYGVVELGPCNEVLSIEEKPLQPKSNIAVTGLYFYDNQVIEVAKQLKPSQRGELEITDINLHYIRQQTAQLHLMGRGFAWLDAGTYESLMQASHFVQIIEERQGHYVASLEEIAFEQGFICANQLMELGEKLGKSPYGHYLIALAHKGKSNGN